MSTLDKPNLPRNAWDAIIDDQDRVNRGPKHIVGKNQWRIEEDADGCLCVMVRHPRTGQYVRATFDAATGSWDPVT